MISNYSKIKEKITSLKVDKYQLIECLNINLKLKQIKKRQYEELLKIILSPKVAQKETI